jgi:hypothetical protein
MYTVLSIEAQEGAELVDVAAARDEVGGSGDEVGGGRGGGGVMIAETLSLRGDDAEGLENEADDAFGAVTVARLVPTVTTNVAFGSEFAEEPEGFEDKADDVDAVIVTGWVPTVTTNAGADLQRVIRRHIQ